MNLKILNFKKQKEELMLIGKTGYLRIKKDFAKKHSFNKQDQWVFAIETTSDSLLEKNNIYLLRNYKENPACSKKMVCINNSWSIDANILIEELNLSTPLCCKLSFFKDKNLEGFNIIPVAV